MSTRSRGTAFPKVGAHVTKVFFTLKCDQPIESLAVFNDDEAAGNDELTGESVKGVITFKGDAPTALVKVAISSVSCENALANLRTELSHWDFDEVRNEAIDKWNDQLSCISIDTKDERAKKIFYTAMYHAFIVRRCIATRMAISVAMTIRCIRTILGRTIPLLSMGYVSYLASVVHDYQASICRIW